MINKSDSDMIREMYTLLIGTKHQAGLVERVENAEELLNGKSQKFGIVQKVNIIWKLHIWLASAIGAALCLLAQALFHIKIVT